MDNMLLVYNAHLVDKNIDIKDGAILIKDGVIEGFVSKKTACELLKDDSVYKYDARGHLVMPSFIDMHAHFRDPGLTHKEDIITGSMAAARGGYSTVVLMPNTSPVVSSEEMAESNNAKAKEAGYVDVIQSVSITKDFDGKTLFHLDTLDPKVVPLITEDGKEVTDSSVMLEAMKKAQSKDIIVSCHSEDPFLASKAKFLRNKALQSTDIEEKIKYLEEANKILSLAEDTETYRNIRLAASVGCHVHLCHVSTKESMDCVREAKSKGYNVTCEVTPHHLSLVGEDDNVFEIVNPPLRSYRDQKSLIEALLDGTADVIATDHAPHTAEDKAGGSPGFSGIETSFAVCYTKLCRDCGFSLNKLSMLMSYRPAEILGLEKRGLLKEGYDASFVIIDEDELWTVEGKDFASKGKYTPLEGKQLYGKILATYLRGKLVFEQ